MAYNYVKGIGTVQLGRTAINKLVAAGDDLAFRLVGIVPNTPATLSGIALDFISPTALSPLYGVLTTMSLSNNVDLPKVDVSLFGTPSVFIEGQNSSASVAQLEQGIVINIRAVNVAILKGQPVWLAIDGKVTNVAPASGAVGHLIGVAMENAPANGLVKISVAYQIIKN